MSEVEFLKKRIDQLDKKTDEFADLFHHINNKYFDFDNPDEFQKSAQLLNTILHRGEEWQIQACVRILSDLIRVEAKGGCFSSMIGIKGDNKKIKELYFKVYDEPEEIDKLQKLIMNTVKVKGQKA